MPWVSSHILREEIKKFLQNKCVVGHKNKNDTEVWLATYPGSYIGNCLSFLSDFLERVEIEDEKHDLKLSGPLGLPRYIMSMSMRFGKINLYSGLLQSIQLVFESPK